MTTPPATAEAPAFSPARLLLTLALAAYGLPLARHPADGSLLDGVNLAIHETGHLLFAPFGDFLQFAGGTITQLAFPLIFAGYFWRRGDRHSATVALWWFGQSWWNVSVYIDDARDLQLNLVGGGEHDWAYLLERLGVLHLDHQISRMAWATGMIAYAVAVVAGVHYARRSARAGSGPSADFDTGMRQE